MTARELLSAMAFALATGETPKQADWYPDPRSFEAAIDAYRAEILREAADEIRAMHCTIRLTIGPNVAWEAARDDAAALIDPDKAQP